MSEATSDQGRPEIETPFGEIAAGEIREIVAGVWIVSNPVSFPPGSQNGFAFEDEVDGRAAWTIVDPGFRKAEGAWLEALAGPLARLPVGRVIATHHHPDHIGAAGALQSRFDAPLVTTRTAWLLARMLQLDAWTEPPEESRSFYLRAGFDAEMIARWEVRAKTNFSVTVAPMPLGYERIAEGDRIAIGPRMFRVEIGHGHAPEHAVFVSETDDLVVGGDQLLPLISPNISVYPTEPDEDPLGAWLESCARLAGIIDDGRLILPGHGPVFRGASARLRSVVAKHERRLQRLYDGLAEPARAVDTWRHLFGRPIPPAAEGLATGEALSHLHHLRTRGLIARREVDGAHWWRRVG